MFTSTRSVVVTRIVAAIAATTAVACSEGESVGQRSAAYTLPDGAVVDAPGEEVGDGWVTGEAGSSETGGDAGAAGCFPEPATTVNTFVPSLVGIEIDDPNANLKDDGLAGVDWADVPADGNHLITDNDSAQGTGFPGPNACLNPAGDSINTPPKNDILQVGLASNNSRVFLNALRLSGEGDSGYAIVVTRERPVCVNKDVKGGSQCNGRFLKFDFRLNDVLIWGHFRTGDTKLLEAYTFKGANQMINAKQAMDFADKNLWTDPVSDVLVAVNTTATDVSTAANGSNWAPDGVTSFADRTFAEGSVPLSLFGNVCGQTLWMTVLTNTEGNDPKNGDPKDAISPRRVNFGSLTATAHAKPNCDGTVDLQATVAGAAGTASCTWYRSGDPNPIVTSPNCDYIKGVALPTGDGPFSYYVVASDTTDAGTGCAATSAPVSVTRPTGIVLNNVSAVDPTVCTAATPNVDGSEVVKYSAQPTAGSASVTTYAWQSCLPDGTECTTITCANEAGDQPYECRYALPSSEGACVKRLIKVTADDDDPAGKCPAVSKTRLVTKVTTISTSAP